jgi:uncharacterized phiE125 gp8 family phage protein
MPWNRAKPLESMRGVRSSLRVSVPPTVEPVSVAELKEHARIDHGHEDARLASLITTARLLVEKDTRRKLCTQTVVLSLDYLPSYLVPDILPIQSISGITYYDGNNALQTLAASTYEADLYAEPVIIRPAFGQTWPTTYDRFGAVLVTMVAGYGAASAVPEDAKQAILLLASHWVENRESVLTGTISKEIELSYTALTDRLKWGNYA